MRQLDEELDAERQANELRASRMMGPPPSGRATVRRGGDDGTSIQRCRHRHEVEQVSEAQVGVTGAPPSGTEIVLKDRGPR
jgi:hypothetical protein